MYKKAYIAFGSNIGDAENNIRQAYEALELIPGIETVKISEMYITKPWGYAEQDNFVNACCEIKTKLSPEALLGACLGIEAGMGRIRTIKNGPRIIDIDLLLYENEVRNTEELILPHPRMSERSFVLLPLKDLAENGYIMGLNIEEMLKNAKY